MLQPAVKKETKNVIIYTVVGSVLMILVFLILHLILPKVPFNYTVFLGAVCGSAIAILNFFLLAITVQKVASMEDRDTAQKLMRSSSSKRLVLQCLWIVAVIFAPCFQLFAGILPILFPSFGIKIYGIFRKDLKSDRPAPETDGSDSSDTANESTEQPAPEDCENSSNESDR